MTLNAHEIIHMLFADVPKHTGWFRKGERYATKDGGEYVILYDTPKNNMTVSVRIVNPDGTVFDRGAKGRGVMAKDIRDATPIRR